MTAPSGIHRTRCGAARAASRRPPVRAWPTTLERVRPCRGRHFTGSGHAWLEVTADGSSTPTGRPRADAPPCAQEHRHRPGAHQDVVQQHDRDPHGQGRERDRVGVGRLGRVQGLPEVDAVRGAGHGRRLRAEGDGHGLQKVEVFVKGPARSARRRSGRSRPQGSRSSASRTSRRRTTASARRSGGVSNGENSRPDAAGAAVRA